MYNSTPKCPTCLNVQFREIIIEHSLKTRDVKRKEMHIQNLPVEQCVVCGEKNLTSKSEMIIDSLKEMIQKQLNDSAAMERASVTEQKKNQSFFKKISNLIR